MKTVTLEVLEIAQRYESTKMNPCFYLTIEVAEDVRDNYEGDLDIEFHPMTGRQRVIFVYSKDNTKVNINLGWDVQYLVGVITMIKDRGVWKESMRLTYTMDNQERRKFIDALVSEGFTRNKLRDSVFKTVNRKSAKAVKTKVYWESTKSLDISSDELLQVMDIV